MFEKSVVDKFEDLDFSERTTLFSGDLLALAEIYKKCFEAAPWNENWPLKKALDVIDSYVAVPFDIIVQREEGRIVGFSSGKFLDNNDEMYKYGIGDRIYYIADLAVDPQSRAKGIGYALVEEISSLAFRRGADSIITRTKTDNLPALKVIKANGFSQKLEETFVTGGVESRRIIFLRF